MKKTFIILFFCFGLFFDIAFADVGIQITDLKNHRMRVTYLWHEQREGLLKAVFPEQGFLFADGPLDVISAVERNSETEVEYQLVPAPHPIKDKTDATSVMVVFLKPVPRSGYWIEITVEAATKNISEDSQGLYVFTYTTTHTAFFALPETHAIVHCNYPVIIFQANARTIIKIPNSGTSRDLLLKTKGTQSH